MPEPWPYLCTANYGIQWTIHIQYIQNLYGVEETNIVILTCFLSVYSTYVGGRIHPISLIGSSAVRIHSCGGLQPPSGPKQFSIHFTVRVRSTPDRVFIAMLISKVGQLLCYMSLGMADALWFDCTEYTDCLYNIVQHTWLLSQKKKTKRSEVRTEYVIKHIYCFKRHKLRYAQNLNYTTLYQKSDPNTRTTTTTMIQNNEYLI